MARSPKRPAPSDARQKRRKARNKRGMKLRANHSPDLSETEAETTEALTAGSEPEPPPATDVRSHWIRWGAVAAAAAVCGVAAGAAFSVQIGLIVAVAVVLGGGAFLVMLFPPPVHTEGGDPAGLNFGRTPADSGAADSAPPNRATRRANRDAP